ncbi:unnamed protein product [Trichobilharzia regenti]|nr:unnamed protein product [Trichobilharzia regenti]
MCFKTPPQQQDPYVNSPSHKAFTRAFLSKSTVAFGQDDYLACPLGVLFMLSILLGTGGTQGNTSYQIGKSIRLKSMFSPTNQTEAREEIKSLYKELVESLTTEIRTENRKTNQVIKISTGTFVHETVEINPKFQQSLKDDFQEELERNTRFTFVVILPLNKWELSKPVEVLNGNKILSKYVGKLKETTVSLRMPKFKLEKTIDLVKPLEDIGIVDLFRPLQADITGEQVIFY